MSKLPNIDLLTLKPGLPLYIELHGQLRRYIEEMEDLIMLPTERTLAEAYGVSRVTVRNALQILKDEGLVSSRRGCGYIIQRPKSARPEAEAA